VSLILEALKKLDREKQAPDRGVVIVGPSGWPAPREGLFALRGAGLVLAALMLGGAAGAAWLLGVRYSADPPAQPAVAAAPAKPVPAAPADAYRPVAAAPSRGAAARPKARPEPKPGTDAAPAAGETEPAPAEAAPVEPEATAAESTPPEPPPTEDPRSRSASRRSGAADFQLQAISAQNGQPVAMLNDRLVREGDIFDDVRVVRIGADEVEIEVGGHRRIVKF
jgi:hypothetical protein